MRFFTATVTLLTLTMAILHGQDTKGDDKARQEIYSLIDQYSEARDKVDTVLLKSILTTDVDQLVSSGEWRNGIDASIEGMMRSSTINQGNRKLSIDKIRFLGAMGAIVDARYEIENADGTTRKMWSTFIVVLKEGRWKISGIRNMLPTGQ